MLKKLNFHLNQTKSKGNVWNENGRTVYGDLMSPSSFRTSLICRLVWRQFLSLFTVSIFPFILFDINQHPLTKKLLVCYFWVQTKFPLRIELVLVYFIFFITWRQTIFQLYPLITDKQLIMTMTSLNDDGDDDEANICAVNETFMKESNRKKKIVCVSCVHVIIISITLYCCSMIISIFFFQYSHVACF